MAGESQIDTLNKLGASPASDITEKGLDIMKVSCQDIISARELQNYAKFLKQLLKKLLRKNTFSECDTSFLVELLMDASRNDFSLKLNLFSQSKCAITLTMKINDILISEEDTVDSKLKQLEFRRTGDVMDKKVKQKLGPEEQIYKKTLRKQLEDMIENEPEFTKDVLNKVFEDHGAPVKEFKVGSVLANCVFTSMDNCDKFSSARKSGQLSANLTRKLMYQVIMMGNIPKNERTITTITMEPEAKQKVYDCFHNKISNEEKLQSNISVQKKVLSQALREGLSWPEASQVASMVVGSVITKIGTPGVVWRRKLDEALRREASTRHKILSRSELVIAMQRHRQHKECIVFTNGCFDLLHVGHMQYLQQARALGDLLIVAMNGDASVRRLKGRRRPLIPQDERASTMAALAFVDYVTLFHEDTPLELIDQVRPDILVKGGNYTLETVVGRKEVEAYGGKVYTMGHLEGVSTTNIIESVLKSYGSD